MSWVFTISKEFAFSASHTLNGLHPGHPCGRLHGHNYRVRVVLISPTVDPVGFIIDYGDLDPFGQWINAQVDHRHLNDVLACNPTAENLARHLAEVVGEHVPLPQGCRLRVEVSETPKTWASWEEE